MVARRVLRELAVLYRYGPSRDAPRWRWVTPGGGLAGAQLNAEIEHQTAEDTTVGEERPLGARRARTADTVGAVAVSEAPPRRRHPPGACWIPLTPSA